MSDAEVTRKFSILYIVTNYCGQYLTPYLVEKMTNEIVREIENSSCSWSFRQLGAEKKELYRHEKTGEVYEVICNANDESTNETMVVYRNTENGNRWVRPAKEFNDGRFTRIDA